jgi:hypothetical protein
MYAMDPALSWNTFLGQNNGKDTKQKSALFTGQILFFNRSSLSLYKISGVIAIANQNTFFHNPKVVNC